MIRTDAQDVSDRRAATRRAQALRLGVAAYSEALSIQRRVHAAVAGGEMPDTLLLLEHPHVYTVGRRGREEDILLDEAGLARLGAEVHHTDRGGEATYHGPGQLVGYPIVNLRRMGMGPLKYVRALERALTGALEEMGVEAQSEGRPTGVWVAERKIAAIGVKVSRRVTTHGFALNVSTDLSYFDHVVACGMPGAEATSVSRELGRAVAVDEAAAIVAEKFGEVMGVVVEVRETGRGGGQAYRATG